MHISNTIFLLTSDEFFGLRAPNPFDESIGLTQPGPTNFH